MKRAAMVLFLAALGLLVPGIPPAGSAARPGTVLYAPDFSQGTWGCGLDLTAEQTEKMAGLQESFLKETGGLRARLREEQNRLRELWNRRDPDRKEIAAAEDEIQRLEARISGKAAGYRLEAQEILTPAQMAQLGTFPRRERADLLAYGMRGEVAKGRREGTGWGSCPRF